MATSHFAATPQSDVVRICAHDFQHNGDAIGTTENACFRAFITLRSITISPTSLFSGNFNGNRVKNHPKPWTCPLRHILGKYIPSRTDWDLPGKCCLLLWFLPVDIMHYCIQYTMVFTSQRNFPAYCCCMFVCTVIE